MTWPNAGLAFAACVIAVEVVAIVVLRKKRARLARARHREALRTLGWTHFGLVMGADEDVDAFRMRIREVLEMGRGDVGSPEWRRNNPQAKPAWVPEERWNEKPN